MAELIARVTRCSTSGFVGAAQQLDPQTPTFGLLCKVEAQGGRSSVIGAIYDISIEDDPLARMIAASDSATPEQISDHIVNRQIPVEISAIAIGYLQGEDILYGLPPQPPLTMAPIYVLSDEETVAFTAKFDFLGTLLNTPQVNPDELTTAVIISTAKSRPAHERRAYLEAAGRACSRLLNEDFVRLERLVDRIRPETD